MTAIDGSTTWTYSYNKDGLRTQRTDGTTTYNYVYLGNQLKRMTVGNVEIYFSYDSDGSPMSMVYNGTTYYYVKNLQGDVVGIVDKTGVQIASYCYDAWGNPLSVTSNTTANANAATIAERNPLRYRGYVYDTETNLYYLQSRYYNPETGRFINADALVSTGQGLLGNNMYAYCCNRAVVYADISGTEGYRVVGVGIQFEVTVDNVCIGVEVIMYLDPTVCDGNGPQIVMYTYSGVSLDFLDPDQYMRLLTELAAIADEIEFAEDSPEIQALSHSAITALKGFILQEAGLSYSAVLIVGNDSFVDASSYSGPFDSVSATANKLKVTYAQSSSCFAIAVGRSTDGLSLSYSYSNYSDPIMLVK